ncbi:UNVERIFIED_CONTAM: hypothetical protein HDU68_000241 [Siphonaria sp. JEL0065]|nr:hypothetical protein HDU68_000241 [Siphonaria sp. JEL0065]
MKIVRIPHELAQHKIIDEIKAHTSTFLQSTMAIRTDSRALMNQTSPLYAVPSPTLKPNAHLSLPLSCYQGIFRNPEHGVITTFEAGSTSLLFDLKAAVPTNPDLAGVICPWKNDTMAVCELPLLDYKNYTDPVMMFEFDVDQELGIVVGFHFNLDEGAPPVQFIKIA